MLLLDFKLVDNAVFDGIDFVVCQKLSNIIENQVVAF